MEYHRVDYLTDAVMELAKNKQSRQVQVRSQPQGKNPAQTSLIGRNWILLVFSIAIQN